VIRDRALDKLVSEFEYLRAQAVGPLAKFLDFVVMDYQIDNVMLILKATLNNPNVDMEAIVAVSFLCGFVLLWVTFQRFRNDFVKF
jgi:vacuolar-type H+-ATPase subunit C/Vma6